ncbi:hypothetical protein BE11_26795 [Sorangium cellulosum]|nr:hypothetical protein BE11_26795 [Sorangium cellulosum]
MRRLRAALALQKAGPAITLALTLGAALWLHLDISPGGELLGFAVAQPGEPPQPVSAGARAHAVACVPERASLGLREGDAAELRVRGQGGDPIAGTVVAVGPLVSALPLHCWPTPKVSAWGRVVTIALDAPVALAPGQAFDITLDSPRGDDGGRLVRRE